MTSIADVARSANVSLTTVSHVLSGKRPVSQAVQQRVRDAMAQLNYVPSRSAQNLARGSTQTIGLLVPDISNSFFADLAKGVESACIEDGFNMILCNTGWNNEREVAYLETLRSRAVDGVIYSSGSPPRASELARLLTDLPTVAVDERLPGISVTSVASQNKKGGREAASHLIGLGHRYAAVIGVTPSLASSSQRRAGFMQAWAEAGLTPPTLVRGDFTEEAGRQAVEQLLPEIASGEITAIFATNDLCALGAIGGLKDAGLQLPRDCSVVGFDDAPVGRYLTPSLTTIRQDAVVMGSTAAQILLDLLSDKPVRHSTSLPVELVVRESTSRPRGR